MTEEKECPICGEWIEIGPPVVTCPECKTELIVDPDAEFVDGMWRNLTKLVVVTEG